MHFYETFTIFTLLHYQSLFFKFKQLLEKKIVSKELPYKTMVDLSLATKGTASMLCFLSFSSAIVAPFAFNIYFAMIFAHFGAKKQ